MKRPVGRPFEQPQQIIHKYPQVVEALRRGETHAQIAIETNVSLPTIRKVRAAMKAVQKRNDLIIRVMTPQEGESRFELAKTLGFLDFPNLSNPFNPELDSTLHHGYVAGFDDILALRAGRWLKHHP